MTDDSGWLDPGGYGNSGTTQVGVCVWASRAHGDRGEASGGCIREGAAVHAWGTRTLSAGAEVLHDGTAAMILAYGSKP